MPLMKIAGMAIAIKVKYFIPLTSLWEGELTYIGFTNVDWGSNLRDKSDASRTSNAIASSDCLEPYPFTELRSLALLLRGSLVP